MSYLLTILAYSVQKEILLICNSLLSRELGKLFVWFSVNKLSLHLSKTNYILFRNHSAYTALNICITTINVTRVQSSKFLAIIIDENLNCEPHIQLVKSKLSKTLSIIYEASTLINYEGMLTLYCSLFLPYLTYCCEILQLMSIVYTPICDTK